MKSSYFSKLIRPEQCETVPRRNERGFSLIEALFAMVIMMISILGVFQVFTYSIMYNTGNATRAQALAILQQEAEFLRSKKFNPSGAVDTELTGGVKPPKYVDAPNGGRFRVDVTVDDLPLTDNAPGSPDIDPTTDYKEITITARLEAPSPGWQFAVPATVVMRRTRGN